MPPAKLDINIFEARQADANLRIRVAGADLAEAERNIFAWEQEYGQREPQADGHPGDAAEYASEARERAELRAELAEARRDNRALKNQLDALCASSPPPFDAEKTAAEIQESYEKFQRENPPLGPVKGRISLPYSPVPGDTILVHGQAMRVISVSRTCYEGCASGTIELDTDGLDREGATE